MGKTEGKRKLRRRRGGRERGDEERGKRSKRRRKREMDGGKASLEERDRARERREQRETWEGEGIDRGIGAWFTGGTHVWPIGGRERHQGRHQGLEKRDAPESATLWGAMASILCDNIGGWG